MKRSKGFGFAIDYEQAIAQDAANLAIHLDPKQVALCQTVTAEEYHAANAHGFTNGMAWIDHLTYHTADNRWRTEAERAPLLALAGVSLVELHAIALYCGSEALEEHLDAQLSPEQRRPYREAYAHGKALSAAHAWILEPGRYMLEAGRKRLVSYWRGELARHKRNRAKYGQPQG